MEEWVVEEKECLGRNRGGTSLGRTRIGVGAVKQRKEGMSPLTLDHHECAAPIGRVYGMEWRVLSKLPSRLWRERVGGPHGEVEVPRREQ